MTNTAAVVLDGQIVTMGMAATSFPATGGNTAVGAVGLALQVVCVYSAAVTVGVLVEVLTSPDNANYDTEAYVTQFVPIIAAGGTRTLTIAIPYAEDIKYYRVRLTGHTATVGVTATITINGLAVTP